MPPTKEQLAALNRLWNVANGHSSQCRIVAAFLLGLYDGETYTFDLTSFRALDTMIFRDCLLVLEMDSNPEREIHQHLGAVNGEFEQLAAAWGLLPSPTLN